MVGGGIIIFPGEVSTDMIISRSGDSQWHVHMICLCGDGSLAVYSILYGYNPIRKKKEARSGDKIRSSAIDPKRDSRCKAEGAKINVTRYSMGQQDQDNG